MVTTNLADNPNPNPVQQAERIQIVDILRGFALFGILLVNMALFSYPFQSILFPADPDMPWYDWVATWLIHFWGRANSALFSLLFGLGMILLMERIEAPREIRPLLRPGRVAMAVDDLLAAAADAAILIKTAESGSPTNDTQPAARTYAVGCPPNRQGVVYEPRLTAADENGAWATPCFESGLHGVALRLSQRDTENGVTGVLRVSLCHLSVAP